MPLDNKTILEAVKQAKTQSGGKKFNQTIDMILDIQEVDMKAPEGKIQEVLELPKPTGKPNKVCIVASGEFALKARNAQADFVLERDALEGLTGNKKELRKLATKYDIFVVEAPMMPLVGKILGPVLGPRGKMPMPVPPSADVTAILAKNRNTIVIRMRTQPVIQVSFGTEQMSDEDLVENAHAILRVLDTKLKRGLKNIKFMFIKTSMGEPVKIKP
ncbi:MAG: 50S ribosomal protein L1 [Candidatus Bathyarchaeota archaeon]|nr:50S ribosomal protein L1 [Candidatus Termiticorpusculum sp.]MCL1971132.1 50S ribosomal protein L1 [Candidatus Termiticorpusculum sp.]